MQSFFLTEQLLWSGALALRCMIRPGTLNAACSAPPQVSTMHIGASMRLSLRLQAWLLTLCWPCRLTLFSICSTVPVQCCQAWHSVRVLQLTSKWSADAARWIGLLPTSPIAFTSPPALISCCSTSTSPLYAAQCMPMSCVGVRLRAEAPWSSSNSTPAVQPTRTAHCL